jgi:DHA1 family bicyclomycin/chloramphenicol resistance-like MFS transporter
MTDAPKIKWVRMFRVSLVAATGAGPLSLQIFVPGLPAIAEDLATSPSTANLALSLSLLGIGLATLIYGPLADKLGRRPVLLSGLGIYLFGTAICAVAPNMEILIFGRLLQAGGAASGLVITRTIVRDVFGAERAASVFAYITMAMILAPMLALILGGFIVDFWGWRWTFILSFAFGVILIGLVFTAVPETRPPGTQVDGVYSMLGNYGRLIRMPAFSGYALHSGFMAGAFYAFMAAAPILMIGVMGRTASEFAFHFIGVSIAYMLANFLAARYSVRFGVEKMVIAGGLISVVAAIGGGLWLLVGGLTPVALFGTAAMVALGNGVSIPNAFSGAVNTAPHIAGTASAATAFTAMFAGFLFAQGVVVFADGSALPLLIVFVGGTFFGTVAGIIPSLSKRTNIVATAGD